MTLAVLLLLNATCVPPLGASVTWATVDLVRDVQGLHVETDCRSDTDPLPSGIRCACVPHVLQGISVAPIYCIASMADDDTTTRGACTAVYPYPFRPLVRRTFRVRRQGN